MYTSVGPLFLFLLLFAAVGGGGARNTRRPSLSRIVRPIRYAAHRLVSVPRSYVRRPETRFEIKKYTCVFLYLGARDSFRDNRFCVHAPPFRRGGGKRLLLFFFMFSRLTRIYKKNSLIS